jgi:hypothetical protein
VSQVLPSDSQSAQEQWFRFCIPPLVPGETRQIVQVRRYLWMLWSIDVLIGRQSLVEEGFGSSILRTLFHIVPSLP